MSDKRKEAPYHLVRHCSYQAYLFTKLSKHNKFSEDEDVLKGYIKQYKDKKIDTVNSIYC